MKAVTLILDMIHIIVSIALLVLMPVIWAEDLMEEVYG